jgi:hypothetical protein
VPLLAESIVYNLVVLAHHKEVVEAEARGVLLQVLHRLLEADRNASVQKGKRFPICKKGLHVCVVT